MRDIFHSFVFVLEQAYTVVSNLENFNLRHSCILLLVACGPSCSVHICYVRGYLLPIFQGYRYHTWLDYCDLCAVVNSV